MPKKRKPRRPPPSVTSAPTELTLRKAEVLKAVGGSPTEPSIPLPVDGDGVKTDESAAHALAATDEAAAMELPGPAAIVDPGATDESVAHRAGRMVPVRSDRVRRPGSRRDAKKKGAPSRGRLLAGVVVALVLAIGWLAFGRQAPKAPVVDGHAKDAQAAFQAAKNLIRKGQWKDAKVELDALAQSTPAPEGLDDYLKAAQVEAPLQEHLDAAQQALTHAELGHAAKELQAVPDSSKQFFRKGELDVQLGKAVEQKVKEALPLASSTSDKDKMRKLKALAEDVLAARPNNRDAQQLLSTADRALGAKPVVAAAPDPGDPTLRVTGEYAAGNMSGAFAAAEACAPTSARCAELKRQLIEAQELFKRVESLEEADLLHAVRLDRILAAGKQSANGKQAGVRLAAVLYPKASSAAAREEWGYALAASRKILEGDPQHEGAHGIVSESRAAAQQLFQRCYVGRQTTPEDALPLCKRVVDMLPESDELHGKAQRILTGSVPE